MSSTPYEIMGRRTAPDDAAATPATAPGPHAGESPRPRRLTLAWARRLSLSQTAFTYLVLAALTLLGGLLRLTWLDHPTIWGDEALTFSRICGSAQEMYDVLRTDRFAPLHYQLYWWIAQGLPMPGFLGGRPLLGGPVLMTPHVMRLVPAVAGTLFVPAVFFLARQFTTRPRSLLAAGLAAVSAYAIVYSRDAKMYMHFWLACTLFAACLLAWVRTGRPLLYLGWVTAGVAMTGLHLLGFMVLGVMALSLPLVVWRRWGTLGVTLLMLPWMAVSLVAAAAAAAVALLCALATVFVAPVVAVLWFMPERRETARRLLQAVWRPARLTFNARDDLARGRAGRYFQRHGGPAARGVLTLVLAAGGLALVSLVPLHYLWYFNPTIGGAVEPNAWSISDADVGRAGIQWVAAYNQGRTGGELLLFTASAYLTGWEWPQELWQLGVDPRTLKLMKFVTVVLIAALAAGLVAWRRPSLSGVGPSLPPWRGTLVMAAWLLLPTYGLYLFSVPQDRAAPAEILVGLFAENVPEADWPHWPVADEAAEAAEASAGTAEASAGPGVVSTATTLVGETAASAAAFVDGLSGVRWHPWRLAALALALCVAAWFCDRTLLGRLKKAGVTLAVVVLILLAAQLAWVAVAEPAEKNIWMPRYLGVVFPGVLVAAAVLICRLPTWPLRTAVVAVFVAVNLGQFAARTFGPSEPPTHLIAADALAGSGPEATQATFIGIRTIGAEPGRGTFWAHQGRYFLAIQAGYETTPREFRRGWGGRSPINEALVDGYVGVRSTQQLQQRMQRLERSRPGLNKVVVWDEIPAGGHDHADRTLDALGEGWRRVEEETFLAHDHWTWRDLFELRRRVYERR
ncbi:MAG: hypothetical protein ACFCVE_01820 [Phycisphaerae bacterium]